MSDHSPMLIQDCHVARDPHGHRKAASESLKESCIKSKQDDLTESLDLS